MHADEDTGKRKINYEKLSIRDVAEATLGDDVMRKLGKTQSEGFLSVGSESVDPTNLSAFTNITGNMIFEATLDSFKAAGLVGDQLVTAESSTRDGGRDTGLAEIDDDAMVVPEAHEFPDVTFGEDYVEIPTSVKRGMKIGITRELLFFDQTGKILDMARSIGDRMGVNKEKRILDMVLGVTNGFIRKGVARNTYVAAGGGEPRPNLLGGNALVDWTDIDAVMQLFDAMGDDRATPEPIMVEPKQMLVPRALEYTAKRILNATDIRVGSDTANTQTYSTNPAAGALSVISTPWFTKRLVAAGVDPTVAAGRYYVGDFKRAFKYRTLFPLQTIAAQHDKDAFERDVVAQFRTSERGVPRIVAPWYVAQFNAA
jgi:hypothetical protein